MNGSVRAIAEGGPKQAAARQPSCAGQAQHGPYQTTAPLG
jgi:hypothetical protein